MDPLRGSARWNAVSAFSRIAPATAAQAGDHGL